MRKLDKYKQLFADLPGWFNSESQAIWDCLLSFQTEMNIQGDFIEIGVADGKSATLSTLHARPDEKCLFVDPILSEPIADRLRGLHDPGSVFLKCISDALNNPKFIAEWKSRFRWIHIDGEHTGMAIRNDLHVADNLLHRQGIICLDDFLNSNYPQVTLAVFRYIDANPGSLSLVLCGFNKGYFCRPYHAPGLRTFIFKELRKELAQRNAGEFTLWRTTMPDDLNAFGITHRFKDTDFRGPDWAPDQVIF